MYRPNEAKVRNLKTKDYLGKARLVAASDRANAFTGFAGSEIKNAGKADIKDDRPADNISFAATNLVKPGLQSKMPGQQGMPNGQNVFPPTPPPENDRPRELPARAASVRNGPKPMPPKLNIDQARSQDRYQKAMSPEEARPRAPARANTGASSRSYSQSTNRGPRRASPVDDDAYPDDVYDMYSNGSRSAGGGNRPNGNLQRRPTQPQRYEDDYEEDGSDYDGNSVDEADFEMMNPRRGTGSVSGSARGQSRKPEVRKVRVKVHADDVRYIMVGTAVEFPDMVDRIRDKFGIRRRFKIKVRDEDTPSEMITMGDQDDLDMVMMGVKSAARKQKMEVGKLEVSVTRRERTADIWETLANNFHRSGCRRSIDSTSVLMWMTSAAIYPPPGKENTCSHDIMISLLFKITRFVFFWVLGFRTHVDGIYGTTAYKFSI